MLTLASVALFFCSSCAVMLPVTATSNPVTPTAKVGKSTATNILGFWITPDAGIKTAATNGNITKIATVDTKITTFLWVYKIVETTVTGD